jgi:hypothetical protein
MGQGRLQISIKFPAVRNIFTRLTEKVGGIFIENKNCLSSYLEINGKQSVQRIKIRRSYATP